jgi:hypothetical protein
MGVHVRISVILTGGRESFFVEGAEEGFEDMLSIRLRCVGYQTDLLMGKGL